MTIKILDYEFEGLFPLDGINSTIKEKPGVYVIMTEFGEPKKWTVIDVGMSDDVNYRINNHDRDECWEKYKVKTIKVAVRYIQNKKNREDTEKDIRMKRNPVCGKR